MIEILQKPWPWYIAGPIIGLLVPLLLILTRHQFGISSSFKHILCSLRITKNPYLNYPLKPHLWNILFVVGISLGGFIGYYLIGVPDVEIHPEMVSILSNLGIRDFSGLLPDDYFSLFPISIGAFILTFGGGFAIGFGTRWATGCTAGHTIMGIAQLSKTSMIATLSFFIGGLISARLLVPLILNA